jgi:hypothetical protein
LLTVFVAPAAQKCRAISAVKSQTGARQIVRLAPLSAKLAHRHGPRVIAGAWHGVWVEGRQKPVCL